MSLHARGAAAARFVAVLILARHTLGIPLERHDSGTSTAVVLWHGMGDTCCLPFSMGAVKNTIEDHVPGAYVTSLMIGSNEGEDQLNGFFLPIHKQLDMACEKIKGDSKLSRGFHIIGFSQGGLFARSLVETCAGIKVSSVISIGGPQNGVFGLPHCTGPKGVCETVRSLLDLGAYNPLVQERLVQAQYWHDPVHAKKYVTGNIFLPAINNQISGKVNVDYQTRLGALERFILVKFEGDTIVIPRESEWFGWYAAGQDETIVPFNQTDVFQEDLLGLKSLYEDGRMVFKSCPGEHLQMPDGYFENEIIPYLTRAA